eukprot:11141.XXX_772797_774448_1 [CDS] Oithona nana genome sequencing.
MLPMSKTLLRGGGRRRLLLLLPQKQPQLGLLRSTSSLDSPTSVDVHQHKLSRPTKNKRTSLIPETLRDMLSDQEFQAAQRALQAKGQLALTKEERKQRQRALDEIGVPSFIQKVGEENLPRRATEVLQLNVGLYCNQACSHCHVESSPKRTEVMSLEVAQRCIDIMRNSPSIKSVDLTGGAPELCPQFRYLVQEAVAIQKSVIDRCNLTALLEPGQEDTAEFLAVNKVHIIASLPCYSAKNVNLQRGSGVFQRSMEALRILNDLGYGKSGSGLILDLVYNPLGAFLPPDQSELEVKYKAELKEMFNIEFNSLYTMTNMPIKRFADFLNRRNELLPYMELLVRNYSVANIDNLMCRELISVNYDGTIFDCDFNQQLALHLQAFNINSFGTTGSAKTVFEIESTDDLLKIPIKTDNHCYGCTAGKGSS